MDRLEQSFIGIGANVGEPSTAVARAIVALAALPGATIGGVSRLYRTRPVGPVAQADFLNAVVELQIAAGPDPESAAMALLAGLKRLERVLGRHERQRWGPREIDLDLLLFGRHELHVQRDDAARSEHPGRRGMQWLDVPHVAAQQRLFVLAPLADLAPELVPPGWASTVREAKVTATRQEGTTAVIAVASWDTGTRRWDHAGIAGAADSMGS